MQVMRCEGMEEVCEVLIQLFYSFHSWDGSRGEDW